MASEQLRPGGLRIECSPSPRQDDMDRTFFYNGLHTDSDIRDFRRRIVAIIATLTDLPSWCPPLDFSSHALRAITSPKEKRAKTVDVFFQRPTPADPSKPWLNGPESATASSHSKAGFEAKVKHCIDTRTTLKLNFKVRNSDGTATSTATTSTETRQAAPAADKALKEIVLEMHQDLSLAKEQAVKLGSQEAELKDAAKALKKQAEDFQQHLATEQATYAAGFRQLRMEHEQEISKAREEATAHRNRADELHRKLQLMWQELRGIEETLKQESAQKDEAESKQDELSRAVQAANDKLQESQRQLEKANAEGEELRRKLQEAEAKLSNNDNLHGRATKIQGAMQKWLAAYGDILSQDATDSSDHIDNSATTSSDDQTRSRHNYRSQDGAQHPDIFCDGPCDGPVSGIRWKCVACPDFDFCDQCYNHPSLGRQRHATTCGQRHVFLAIHEPMASGATRILLHSAQARVNKLEKYAIEEAAEAAAEAQVEAKAVAAAKATRETQVEAKAVAETQGAVKAQAGDGINEAKSPRSQVSVNIEVLDETPLPSSELSVKEKKALCRKLTDASQDNLKHVKRFLSGSVACSQEPGSHRVRLDLDRITKDQFDVVMRIVAQIVEPAVAQPEASSKMDISQSEISHHVDDAADEDEKLDFDSVCVAVAGPMIRLRNVGSMTWQRRCLDVAMTYAGAAWNGRTPAAELIAPTLTRPGQEIMLWCHADESGEKRKFIDTVPDMVCFRLTYKHGSGAVERFGAQAVLEPPRQNLAATEHSGTNDMQTSTELAKETSDPAASGSDTGSGSGSGSLCSSSMLTIPTAPDAIHTPEEAALAASIVRSAASASADADMQSEHGAAVTETTSDGLRSPSYAGTAVSRDFSTPSHSDFDGDSDFDSESVPGSEAEEVSAGSNQHDDDSAEDSESAGEDFEVIDPVSDVESRTG